MTFDSADVTWNGSAGDGVAVCSKYCMIPLDVHSTNTVGCVNGIGGSVVESTTITALSFQMKTTELDAARVYFLSHSLDQWGIISAVSSTIYSAAISVGLAHRLGELWTSPGDSVLIPWYSLQSLLFIPFSTYYSRHILYKLYNETIQLFGVILTWIWKQYFHKYVPNYLVSLPRYQRSMNAVKWKASFHSNKMAQLGLKDRLIE